MLQLRLCDRLATAVCDGTAFGGHALLFVYIRSDDIMHMHMYAREAYIRHAHVLRLRAKMIVGSILSTKLAGKIEGLKCKM